jgi:dihydroflavonol-4-reductase
VAQLALPFIGAAARLTGNEPLYTRESLKTIARPPAVDCSRAVRELGYEARPASETVADVYRWFEEAGV